MAINIEKLKHLLNEEKRHLEAELNAIGVKTGNPNDWEATADQVGEIDTRDEVAERLESTEERRATEIELEPRLKAINEALARIEDGTYGKCQVDGAEIEEERLEANPTAKTCKEHLAQEEKFN